MAINDSDLLLVENNSQTETITFAQFKAGTVLNDTDNFLINDGAKTEKVAWSEIKDELVPPITGEATVTPVDIKTGGTLTCTVFAAGGVPPYTYNYQWYYKFGTIFGWTPFPSPDSPTLTIPDDQVGRTFRCNVTITDDAGTTEEVVSSETLPVVAGTRPPVIDSVTLVENNPNTDPRFTSQKFTAKATLSDDGEPASVKAFTAYVVGALTTEEQFDEPLESVSSSGVSYSDGFTYTTNSSSGPVEIQGQPDDMFDGQINGYTAYGYKVNGNNQTCVVRFNIPADATWAEGPCYVGVQVQSNSRYYQGNSRPQVTSSLSTPVPVNEVIPSNGNYYIQVPAGERLEWFEVRTGPSAGIGASFAEISGWWRFDSQPTSANFTADSAITNIPERTDLVFAAGTNMVAISAGDEVVQSSTKVGPIYSGFGTFADTENIYDGDDDTFGQSPAMGDDTVAYFLENPGGTTCKILGFCTQGFARIYAGSYIGSFIDFTPVDGKVEKEFSIPTGTLGSLFVKAQSANTLMRIYRVEIDGKVLIDNDVVEYKGTVGSVTDTTLTLTERVNGWEIGGNNVTGPEKEITGDDVKMYLQFDSNGTVTDLIQDPQSPVYAVTAINPSLTLTFPATFPSGQTPDKEIGAGSRLTVDVVAANSAGTTDSVGATVQPTGDPPSYQFREPLDSVGGSSGEINARVWSNTLTAVGGFSASLPASNAFNGDPSRPAGTQNINANITWNTSSFPLSGRLTVVAESSPKGVSYVRVTHSGGTTTITGPARDPSIANYGRYEFAELTNITQVFISQNDATQSVGAVTAFYLDDNIIVDNQPIIPSTVLNFSPLADMSNLAAGDEVRQGEGANAARLTLTGGTIIEGEKANAFDNDSSTSVIGSAGAIWRFDFPQDQPYSSTYCRVNGGTGGVTVRFYNEFDTLFNTIEVSTDYGAANWANSSVTYITLEHKFAGSVEVYEFGTNNGVLIDDPVTTGTVESINGTTVQLTEQVDGWVVGEDVVGPDKTAFRSMTQKELAEQKAKFLTYKNRRDVHQGEQAMAHRDAFYKQLQAAGVDPPAIRKILGGTSK